MDKPPAPDGSAAPVSWKKCSTCKKDIPFGAQYYLCSVSTCRHKRTGLRFCSVGCWDAHLGYANHHSSFAEETRAPSRQEYLASEDGAEEEGVKREPQRKVIEPKAAAPLKAAGGLPQTDTLVVVSKVKALIREQSGFNTSECCVDALTKRVIETCLQGIEKARAAGRKTVMGRDID